MALPETPDFDAYPIHQALIAATVERGGVRLEWADGGRCLYHPMTLREHAPDPETTHPVTREQSLMLIDIPADLKVTSARIDGDGALEVNWSTGEAGRYHPGWLRAHAPDLSGVPVEDRDGLSARVTWAGGFANQIPRLAGPDVVAGGAAREAWAEALHVYGVAILEGLDATPEVVETVPGLLGPIRETNFGKFFDVVSKPDADSNAYTSMALPLHVDLATRETMPGLQFLHCMSNEAEGGDSILSDGFYLAECLRAEAPELFEALATVPVTGASKAKTTDYRWTTPIIGTDETGAVTEIRWNPWLRAPMKAAFEDVDKVYRGLRFLFELSERPDTRIVTRLRAGDMLSFDNRRVLHGRTGYDPSTGERRLRGCYVDREHLISSLRMTERRKRAALV
jgi:gamma-butyrobetaine dioxygenase